MSKLQPHMSDLSPRIAFSRPKAPRKRAPVETLAV